MKKRKSQFSVVSFLKVLHIHTDVIDLQKLIYVSLLLSLGFITFISATISWIELPDLFTRVLVQYAFSGLCFFLLALSQKKNVYLIFEFNLMTLALFAYLYYPSGGSLGAISLFILTNALFSWIQLYGESPYKLVISMILHECLFIVNPLIDIFNPGLVPLRYPDRNAQIVNLMIWGSVSILFITLFMWLWSRLLQSKLNALIGKIEIDDLTGAYRKSFMLELIENVRSTSDLFHRKHSLVFIDLDDFKSINDGYSHLVGDEVLSELVEYLRTGLRKNDYICRFGGDEFLLFLPDTKSDEAFSIMERIRQGISKKVWSSKSIKITISVGVGELHMKKNVDYSLELIDKSMYASKKLGKNKVTIL